MVVFFPKTSSFGLINLGNPYRGLLGCVRKRKAEVENSVLKIAKGKSHRAVQELDAINRSEKLKLLAMISQINQLDGNSKNRY